MSRASLITASVSGNPSFATIPLGSFASLTRQRHQQMMQLSDSPEQQALWSTSKATTTSNPFDWKASNSKVQEDTDSDVDICGLTSVASTPTGGEFSKRVSHSCPKVKTHAYHSELTNKKELVDTFCGQNALLNNFEQRNKFILGQTHNSLVPKTIDCACNEKSFHFNDSSGYLASLSLSSPCNHCPSNSFDCDSIRERTTMSKEFNSEIEKEEVIYDTQTGCSYQVLKPTKPSLFESRLNLILNANLEIQLEKELPLNLNKTLTEVTYRENYSELNALDRISNEDSFLNTNTSEGSDKSSNGDFEGLNESLTSWQHKLVNLSSYDKFTSSQKHFCSSTASESSSEFGKRGGLQMEGLPFHQDKQYVSQDFVLASGGGNVECKYCNFYFENCNYSNTVHDCYGNYHSHDFHVEKCLAGETDKVMNNNAWNAYSQHTRINGYESAPIDRVAFCNTNLSNINATRMNLFQPTSFSVSSLDIPLAFWDRTTNHEQVVLDGITPFSPVISSPFWNLLPLETHSYNSQVLSLLEPFLECPLYSPILTSLDFQSISPVINTVIPQPCCLIGSCFTSNSLPPVLHDTFNVANSIGDPYTFNYSVRSTATTADSVPASCVTITTNTMNVAHTAGTSTAYDIASPVPVAYTLNTASTAPSSIACVSPVPTISAIAANKFADKQGSRSDLKLDQILTASGSTIHTKNPKETISSISEEKPTLQTNYEKDNYSTNDCAPLIKAESINENDTFTGIANCSRVSLIDHLKDLCKEFQDKTPAGEIIRDINWYDLLPDDPEKMQQLAKDLGLDDLERDKIIKEVMELRKDRNPWFANFLNDDFNGLPTSVENYCSLITPPYSENDQEESFIEEKQYMSPSNAKHLNNMFLDTFDIQLEPPQSSVEDEEKFLDKTVAQEIVGNKSHSLGDQEEINEVSNFANNTNTSERLLENECKNLTSEYFLSCSISPQNINDHCETENEKSDIVIKTSKTTDALVTEKTTKLVFDIKETFVLDPLCSEITNTISVIIDESKLDEFMLKRYDNIEDYFKFSSKLEGNEHKLSMFHAPLEFEGSKIKSQICLLSETKESSFSNKEMPHILNSADLDLCKDKRNLAAQNEVTILISTVFEQDKLCNMKNQSAISNEIKELHLNSSDSPHEFASNRMILAHISNPPLKQSSVQCKNFLNPDNDQLSVHLPSMLKILDPFVSVACDVDIKHTLNADDKKLTHTNSQELNHNSNIKNVKESINSNKSTSKITPSSEIIFSSNQHLQPKNKMMKNDCSNYGNDMQAKTKKSDCFNKLRTSKTFVASSHDSVLKVCMTKSSDLQVYKVKSVIAKCNTLKNSKTFQFLAKEGKTQRKKIKLNLTHKKRLLGNSKKKLKPNKTISEFELSKNYIKGHAYMNPFVLLKRL